MLLASIFESGKWLSDWLRGWAVRVRKGRLERREAPRRTIPKLVAHYWEGAGAAAHVVRDISPTGTFVFADFKWAPGTVLTMRLELTGGVAGSGPPPSVVVEAKVVRQGQYGIGVQFLYSDKSERKGLAAFLKATPLGHLELRNILLLAMMLSLTPTVLSMALAFPMARQRQGVSLAEMVRLVQQPLVLTFSLLLFFGSGNEFILGGYLTTYLTRHLGASVPTASYLLAAYWGALMLGRTILSRLTLHKSAESLILASALTVALSIALLLTAQSILGAAIFVILLGLDIAMIFPTVLGIAGSSYASHSGTVFGILIGIALMGGVTLLG